MTEHKMKKVLELFSYLLFINILLIIFSNQNFFTLFDTKQTPIINSLSTLFSVFISFILFYVHKNSTQKKESLFPLFKTNELYPFFLKKYRDKKLILTLLSLIVLLGFGLRIWNTGNIDLNGDEYRHLNAMKHFYQNGFFEQPRSLVTTYLVIFTKVFVNYDNTLAFRFPFVILGTVSILLVFFLSKTYSKEPGTALLSAYLFSTLPLAIGLSRYIREYAIITFFLLGSAIIIKKYKSFVYSVSILVLWYVCSDILGSTSELALIILIIIFLFQLLKKYFIQITKILKTTKALPLITIIILVYGFLTLGIFKNFHEINRGYLFLFNVTQTPNTFDLNPIGYTWFAPWVSSGLVVLLLVFSFYKTYKNTPDKIQTLELIIIIVTSMIYFLYIGNFPFVWQARYLFYIFPFYLILISIAFFSLKDYLGFIYGKNISTKLLIFTLFLFLFSPYNAIHDLKTETTGATNPLNGQQIYPEKDLCSFLRNNNISNTNLLVVRSWSLDYCLDGNFLDSTEKTNYIFFPENESYEYYDRTNIFTLATYKGEKNMELLKNLVIQNKQINYLIISKFSPEEKTPDFSSIKDFSLTLTKEIPLGQYRYKYLIYKIDRVN